MKKVINFYSVSDEYGEFSNFAPYSISLDGKTWPTTEHYFQAQKFTSDPKLMEKVRAAKTPGIAASIGRDRKNPLRKDWESVKDSVMHKAVIAKFSQYSNLKKLLLSTEDAKLVEHTSNDSYWADNGDGSGKNKLGLILMQVREHLKNQKENDNGSR